MADKRALERTNHQYTFTVKDETGTAVPKSSVTSLKLTLFCLDDDAQTIINSRNAQEHAPGFTGDVTMHATSGLITFNMQAADNQIIALSPGQRQRYERHGLIFDMTAGGKRYVHRDEIIVENIEKVTT